MALLASILVSATTAQDRAAQPVSLFGSGYGLDHLVILVRDLEAAKATYNRVLGFTLPPPGEAGVHPGGTKNSTMRLSNATYIELVGINGAAAVSQHRPEYLAFLERHEGGFLLALHVTSADSTAAMLRERGIRVGDPEQGTVVRARSVSGFPPVTWWTLRPDRSMLPGDPLFFIDYLDRRNPDDRQVVQARYEANGRAKHANTAKRMGAVWVAVRDLDKARAAFEAFGLRARSRREVEKLGARGQEIEAGSGVLLLLQPAASNSSVASFLADRGEGIMGVVSKLGI